MVEPGVARITRAITVNASIVAGGAVGTHDFDAIHFVMEQKMMRGLRDRAEAATT